MDGAAANPLYLQGIAGCNHEINILKSSDLVHLMWWSIYEIFTNLDERHVTEFLLYACVGILFWVR